MPTVIVEDGSGLPDSNSYLSIAEMRARATDRGVDLSDLSDDEVAVILIKSCDYIDSFEQGFVGVREFGEQALAWPRLVCRESLGVPKAVLVAQYYAAIAVHSGTDLFGVVSGADLIEKEEVGPLKVTYSKAAASVILNGPVVFGVAQALAPLMKASGRIEVVRG